MITKKIVCDNCKKVILDSEEQKASNILDMMFGKIDDKEIGYAEVNLVRFDGKIVSTMHFCKGCIRGSVNTAYKEKQK